MTKRLVFATALAGCLAAPAAMAQGTSPLHFGAKVGVLDPDIGGFDDALNLGVQVGYDLFSDSRGTLSVEGEFTTTLSDGDVAGGGEWDADTLAAYGAFRTAGDVYLKAKAGFLDQDIKRAGGSGGAVITNGDDSGFAFGVGGGWRTNRNAAFELEYTVMSDELTFLSLGYVTRF
jgi:outer membrane immunogenic protein